MEEIEREIAATISGKSYLLRYWAINYGTHVGSTIKLLDATAAPIVEFSFETHWNAPGRYILRQGQVKANPDYPGSARLIETAGVRVMQAMAPRFAQATSLDDIFARIKAGANSLLWEAGYALAEAAAQ